ncbi:MAG TPA: tetratricopeptide repeat protein [Blastocatellia bacterium]|nr:tetratricopeptide repeat protein [Blastocatellia bacterium]
MSFNKAKALKTASKYVQQGKYQSAIEEYRQIAQADPMDVTTLNTLGDLFVKVGQTSEAITSFLHIAEHYRVSGFYLKAIAMLKKVSKLDTGNIEVSLKLAGLYAQQKLIVDARHQYLSVAEYYIREGCTQQALEIYQKIADLDPENTAVQIKLAEAFQRENQLDKAYDTFVLAAGEMRRQNKDNEALQTYLRAIKMHPRGQVALASAVNLYLERGDAQNAIELIQELLAERPNDAELLTLLARIHQSTNDLEAAETAIEKMLDSARARYQYAVDLAQLYVQRQDVTGALRVFDRVAEILYEFREEEKAAQLLRDILSLEPQHLGTLTRLAAVYERTHDDHLLIETLNMLVDSAIQTNSQPAAISALKRLLELEPDEIQYRRRLRELLGEEAEEVAPAPSMREEHYDRPARANEEMDFWGQEESADSSYDQGQPDAGAEFSDYSIQVQEAESGAATETWQPAAGNWDTTQFSGGMEAAPSWQSSADDFPQVELGVPTTDLPTTAPPPAEIFEGNEANTASSGLRDELESVDFYLQQGMLDVARYTLDSIASQYPNAPEVQEKLGQLRAAENQTVQGVLATDSSFECLEEVALAPVPEMNASLPNLQPTLPQTPAAVPSDGFFSMPDVATGYLPPAEAEANYEAETLVILPVHPNASLQIGQEMPSLAGSFESPVLETPQTAPSVQPPTQPANAPFDLFEGGEMGDLLEFLDEFKAETEQHNPQEDFETHYNLGLAYKEMDMFEEAIEEFQQAFKAIMNNPAHNEYVSCCSMLSFCFLQKGLPRLASVWLKKGLESPGRSEDVYQALRYDLADAYAAQGELKDAYNLFAEIYAVDVQYRGVRTRMQEIAAQMKQ